MERVLRAIARALEGVKSLDDLLPQVLAEATAIFGADRAMFAVCDPVGRIRRATPHGMDFGPDGRLPVSDGLIRQVLASHESVVVEDVEDSDFNDRESVKLNNIRFMMGVPVMGPTGLMGVLYIDSTHGKYRGPPADKKALLEGLAGLVSIVLQYLQVIEEQRYRYRFTASVFHNVRNTLHVLQTNMDHLGQRVDGDDRDVVNTVKASIDSLGTLSSSVLELHKLETNRSSPAVWVNLSVELHQRIKLLDAFARSVTRQSLHFEAATSPMILTDAARLGMIIDELLLNAVKYSAPDHAVQVAVQTLDKGYQPPSIAEPADPMHRLPQLRAENDAAFVRITVANAHRHGPISPETRRLMFEPYVRTEGQDASLWQTYSSGLGLYVVKELVTSLGGDITLHSDETTTTFVVDLPTVVQIVSS